MSVLHSVAKQVSAPLPEGYRLSHTANLDGRAAQWWESPALRDAAWDEFLEAVPLGHFQQSSRWAQAKSPEGWQPIRRVLTLDDRICGGFQILFRQTRFGRIGYISKGPVAESETPATIALLFDALRSVARISRLRALILQPPDQSTLDRAALTAHGLLPNHLVRVIRATLLVDLALGMEAIGRHIRRSTWSEIRKAHRRGITIREAGEADLAAFFRLMLATCERQDVQPSPASPEALLGLWKAFQPNKIRLTLAEFQGEPAAGGLCLRFGSRVTFWKKGWSGAHRDRHPHQLLQHEAVEWSCKNGYEFFDFAGLRPDIATTVLNGRELSEEQKKARDFINLSHGNHPVLLPEDRIYIPNPGLRSFYRACMAFPLSRKLAAKFLHL